MTMNTALCPVCGEGQLQVQTRQIDVEHKGTTGRVDDHFLICDVCEIEQAGEAELRANKRAMLAFRKQADGLLMGEHVRELRERWQITQSQAAKIFGGGPVAFSKYETNDVAQSEPMDLLLRVAAAVPEAFQWLQKRVGLKAQISERCDSFHAVMTCKPTLLRLSVKPAPSGRTEQHSFSLKSDLGDIASADSTTPLQVA